jgi:hypothetical protein
MTATAPRGGFNSPHLPEDATREIVNGWNFFGPHLESEMSIQRSKTISEATAACFQSFTDCLGVESLAKDEWAENRLADFNLWVSGTGASAQKRASLESRLALEPEAREVILSLLDQLTKTVDKCKTLSEGRGIVLLS